MRTGQGNSKPPGYKITQDNIVKLKFKTEFESQKPPKTE
jgi:hypothetical protein